MKINSLLYSLIGYALTLIALILMILLCDYSSRLVSFINEDFAVFLNLVITLIVVFYGINATAYYPRVLAYLKIEVTQTDYSEFARIKIFIKNCHSLMTFTTNTLIPYLMIPFTFSWLVLVVILKYVESKSFSLKFKSNIKSFNSPRKRMCLIKRLLIKDVLISNMMLVMCFVLGAIVSMKSIINNESIENISFDFLNGILIAFLIMVFIPIIFKTPSQIIEKDAISHQNKS